jgi:hypothetical protein
MKKVTALLDKIASALEAKGKIHLALELDIVSNTLEASSGLALYGVLLDPLSKDKILDTLKERIPDGWRIYAHHMTIFYGKMSVNSPAIMFYKNNKDEKVTLQATSWGMNEFALALRVQTNIPTYKGIPHITVAVSSVGAPKDSVNIQEWMPLDTPLELRGVVADLHNTSRHHPL